MKKIAIIIMLAIGLIANAEHRHHQSVEPDTMPQITQIKSDTTKIRVCEELLDMCKQDGILDSAGVEYYEIIKGFNSVPFLVELVMECALEEKFYDTIGGTDAWDNFVTLVLRRK